MKKNKIDLERTLNSLSSDEARAAAIHKLVGKVDLPIYIIEKAIKYYVNRGEFEYAGDIALEAGMKERAEELYRRAIEDYETKGWFEDAAKLALKIEMKEKAEQLKTLVDLMK